MEDLISGILPLSAQEMSAEEAWEICYSHMLEFVEPGVVFSQFEARLKDHRKQLSKEHVRAQEEAAALEHDRLLFPRQITKPNGDFVFDLHPAKLILRRIVAEGDHIGVRPKDLWNSRQEFKDFKLAEFTRRIYQEERRKKFIRYLNRRREKGLQF